MKKIIIALMLITGTVIPVSLFSQQTELGKILSTAFSYGPLEEFLKEDVNSSVKLDAIFTNNLIPQTTPIYAFDKKIDLKPGKEKLPSTIVVKKIRMKPEKAKLSFTYHDTVKAKLGLAFEDNEWKVVKSWIRMKAFDENGDKTTRVHFKF